MTAVGWGGSAQERPRALDPLSLIAALAVCLAAPAFFVLELPVLGFALLAAGLLLAWVRVRGSAARLGADRGSDSGAAPAMESGADRMGDRGAASVQEATGDPGSGSAHGSGSAPGSVAGSTPRPPSLLRDLSLIAIGLAVVRTIPLAAELDDWSMVKFTLALGGAVAVPYAVSRWGYRDRAVRFPWRAHRPWGPLHWSWLAAVLVLGWLILPWYFIGSGVYRNWPDVDSADLIARLFVGVGAVGIWDELFFICTVFAALLRHFPAWTANGLQAIVFVSFLWELGYRAWGPVLTIPFALVQGFIFLRTHSLAYVVTVHLLFDAVVFAVLVHAHNPQLFDVFVTVP